MPAKLVWGRRPVREVPAVITGPPALISRTTTSLTINILADMPVQAWLEYGTSPSLGAETTHETNYLTSHTQVISGLTAGTTYHVRAHVVNQVGLTTTSPILQFQTLNAQSGTTLQAIIDGTSPGGTADVTGMAFTANATITKSMTLIGGSITYTGTGTGLLVAANDVVIDGMTITGPTNLVGWLDSSRGIATVGTSSARRSGLVIRNVNVSMFRGQGIYLIFPSGALIENSTIVDNLYMGIGLISDLNSVIDGCTVRRVGNNGLYSDPPNNANYNAYGITITDLSSVKSTGTIVRNNIVTDVPTWHLLDTHGGTNIQWLDNELRRANRPIFITASSFSGGAGAQVISGNYLAEPTRRPDVQNTYPYNIRGLTMSSGTATGTGNTFDGFPNTSNGAISNEGGTATLTNTTIINSF